MVTLGLIFAVLGGLRYDKCSLGCGGKNKTSRGADKITDGHERNQTILNASCHS